MVLIGVNSLPVVLLTIGFTGMVISLQTAHLAVKYGAGSAVGAGVAIALARELAPMLTGIVVAGRAGSAICAEISSMKVTEQIDALKAMAVSPFEYLVVPRFLASVIMLPVLTILANVVGFLGGYIIAVYFARINPVSYYNSGVNFLNLSDVIYGLIKAGVFGIIISIVACYQGIITEGGAVGVGKSTTNSVVISTLLIFVANYFLSMIMF
jgi:phospholipid/cholesterol/gamma-HCH transport system permease protein